MGFPATVSPADLRARLHGLMLRDQTRLRRRLDGARKVREPGAQQAVLAEIGAAIDAAEQRVAQRRAGVPAITYPQALPISDRRDEIMAAIGDHQVVIVAGETGSGKTTQLPKMCLELGRGVQGMVGHTQPRRLAARTVAQRIAAELGGELGGSVGYQVRFTDQVGGRTLVKLMTDGILLAEIAGDRLLRQYDTLIIDEAHERSLNIDFLLGYLTQLLPRRPDLKVVITSATIDPERFSRYFGGAPVIEVSGRTYPVEVRYRPFDEREDDQTQAISDAVDELCAEGPGDILVFLSGEREIRDTADALRRRRLRDTEILPLYARLSTAEQQRVFEPHRGRRVVLATNVAETSLTVPGIRYVIDPGTARISRYSPRTKVQRLPIEPVSQASANQRKGRCGRLSDGICIRLYDEEDFDARPAFTDPEIQRTNLASVILQMTALDLGDITEFGFIDPPDRRQVTDGLQVLTELGAFEPGQQGTRRLSTVGRTLAHLPVDPRIARMIVEADRNGCLREVLVIAAGLSIQDPRERPADAPQAADAQHARFAAEHSDFLAYLNLWEYLRVQQRERSSNQFRKRCRAEFLHYLRVREWQDLHAQLRQAAKDAGLTLNHTSAEPDTIHRSLLAGLLSHIGLKDGEKREYQGARNARFAIFPGSVLFARPPQWVMAAELVETSRLWGRTAARIDPRWVEGLAEHLVKRHYGEPHWERRQGAVMATERVTLYGIPIVAGRNVHYGRIDAERSRELFIRQALVEGDWDTRHEFFQANRRLIGDVEDLEDRARRRDILVDDETLFDFYDQRIPVEVISARHFDRWWKRARAADPDLLTFDTALLVNEGARTVSKREFPDVWQAGDLRLPLTYQFEPGTAADGVTVHIPLAVLNQVDGGAFDWQVPGLREELVTTLIRSLPKALRRAFVPAPDTARTALARLRPFAEPLRQALTRELEAMSRVSVPDDAWDLDRVPDHLKMTFRIVDDRGHTVAEGKDLDALKERLRTRMRSEVAAVSGGIARRGLRTWDFGTLPSVVEQQQAGHALKGYPALVDAGVSVAIHTFPTPAEQAAAMWQGTRRLLLLNVPPPARFVLGRLTNRTKISLSAHNPYPDVTALLQDAVACAADRLIAEAGGPAWDADGFAALREHVRAGLPEASLQVMGDVEQVLTAAHAVSQRVQRIDAPRLQAARDDITAQLAGLVYPGFISATGARRLRDLPRYLRAIEARLDKLGSDPHRDHERMLSVQRMQQAYVDALRSAAPGPSRDALQQVRWMLEELRVSLFAQGLGTPSPVSEKRILRAIADARPRTPVAGAPRA